MTTTSTMPETIRDVEQLEELLSRPTPEVIETLGRIEGDLIVLGAAGKMGPSLARMAQRASQAAGSRRRVIAVSRFSSARAEEELKQHGIETLRCDLLDVAQLERLPNAPNVIYMAGMKFGATGQEPLTWALNAYLPGMVCHKYRHSRIVAFSTGNVYGMIPMAKGGSIEKDTPNPVGEYAMSCLGRERIFEHFGQAFEIPIVLIRLNYAIEMRYGVLVDLARRVWTGEAVDLGMGYVNVIWQADANAMALRALEHVICPASVLNVTGLEILRVRDLCEEFGRLMGRPVVFHGSETPDALLSNSQAAYQLFGAPQVSVAQMLRWIADWVIRGGASLGKPTHFEVRDGKY